MKKNTSSYQLTCSLEGKPSISHIFLTLATREKKTELLKSGLALFFILEKKEK